MAVSFNRYALSLPDAEKCELVSSDNIGRGCPNVNYGTNNRYGTTTTTTTCQTTPVTVPLCVLSEVQLRFLCPDDLEEVRALCQDWFPIGEYY